MSLTRLTNRTQNESFRNMNVETEARGNVFSLLFPLLSCFFSVPLISPVLQFEFYPFNPDTFTHPFPHTHIHTHTHTHTFYTHKMISVHKKLRYSARKHKQTKQTDKQDQSVASLQNSYNAACASPQKKIGNVNWRPS